MALRSSFREVRWKIAQYLELRWWQAYLGRKEESTYLRWKSEYWNRFLEQLEVCPSPEERVLDAGCGPAGVFMVLKTRSVDALDPLMNDYQLKMPFFKLVSYPNVRFIQGALETFSPQHPYDTVYCLNAINHVKDLAKCLNQLNTLIKPGGMLVLSVDAHRSSLLKSIFRLLPGDVLHPHQFDLLEYQSMLTQHGFEITRCLPLKRDLIFCYYGMVAIKR